MPAYLELGPPPRLAESVECLWIMRHSGDAAVHHRVVPDGCADLLFTAGPGKPSLQFIGAMTRFEDVSILPGQVMAALRFHPGRWAQHIGIPADHITDQHLALEDTGGKRARMLFQQLLNTGSPEACAALLAGYVSDGRTPTPVQRALAWMRSCYGMVSLDEVANHAGLSPRQFRRQCLRQTGLSPKLLARILRFRYARSRVPGQDRDYAGLAADCGYFDQPHFIADFQHFSGQTPATFSRG